MDYFDLNILFFGTIQHNDWDISYQNIGYNLWKMNDE